MPKGLVDCDAFFASCEQAKNPSLAGHPVLVSGPVGSRSVVSSASYPAKRCGVKAGMPPEEALRLCPNAIIVNGNFNLYVSVHRMMESKLNSYGIRVESTSIDEFYLDFPCSYSEAASLVGDFSRWVSDEIGITISAGIAPNRILAKLASEIVKPQGLTVLLPNELPERIDCLAVERLLGIGKATSRFLRQKGVCTLGQLRKSCDFLLSQAGLSQKFVESVLSGMETDDDHVSAERAKSISCRLTLPFDIDDEEAELHLIHYLSDNVSSRMRKEKLRARTVTVLVRYEDFSTFQKGITLKRSVLTAFEVAEHAIPLWCLQREKGRKVRLIGLRLSGFSMAEADSQLPLLPEDRKRLDLTEALDEIRKRHGSNSIFFASSHNLLSDHTRQGI